MEVVREGEGEGGREREGEKEKEREGGRERFKYYEVCIYRVHVTMMYIGPLHYNTFHRYSMHMCMYHTSSQICLHSESVRMYKNQL